jgi:3-isopropylmalate/(R)-2-methylmalate dehydratase large subunit
MIIRPRAPFQLQRTLVRQMTITEKILAESGGEREAKPGDIVIAKVNLVATMDFLGKVLYQKVQEMGAKRVYDSEKVVVTFDHFVPPTDVSWATTQQTIREQVKTFGGTLYDIGRHGIMHQLVVEEGYVLPGTVCIATDSHAPTGGALGAICMGAGVTDAAIAMAMGELWLMVPESVKVTLEGSFPSGVTSRDVMFYLMGQKGWDGGRGEWAYRGIEIGGETVKRMGMSARLVLTNLVSDMGAKNGIIEPDAVTEEYLKNRARGSYKTLKSDSGAQYAEQVKVDVSTLEPQVACPHSPDNVKPIKEVEGKKVDWAVIGSCTNGRLEDIRVAAELIKGKKVHRDVKFVISPASTRIYNDALKEGLFGILAESGAIIGHSTCGPCIGGQLTVLAPGEVCITATPRNMKGRMGSPDAQIYGANPYVVTASAIEGAITDPRRYLRG